jgi:hypothetical protein
MNHFTSRAYAGAPDLNLLIQFAERAAKARWPRSTYKKVGDMVWGTPGLGPNANIQLWLYASDLVAYGWFGPPLNLDFDIRSDLALYDSVGAEILTWAENRARDLARAGKQTIPKAWAMLGYETVVLTAALDSDNQRLSLLDCNGFLANRRFRSPLRAQLERSNHAARARSIAAAQARDRCRP